MRKFFIVFLFISFISFTSYANITVIGNVSYDSGSTNLAYDAQVNLSIASNKLFLSLKGNNSYDDVNYFSILGKYKFRSLAKVSWFAPYLIINDEVYLSNKFSNRFLTGVGVDLDILKKWKLFNINFETGLNISFEKDTEIDKSIVGWWRSRIEIGFKMSDNFYIKGDCVYALPLNMSDSVWNYSSVSGVIKLTEVISMIASYKLYNYSILSLGEGSLYSIKIKVSL